MGLVDAEANETLRAEQTGGGLDPVVLCIWMRRTRMPGSDLCHTHTHTPLACFAHTHACPLTHARTHTHRHCFGGQGQSLALLGLLCKGGLGKSAHRHASQKVSRAVIMRLRETARCPHPGRLRCGTCAAGKLHFVPSPQTLSFVGKEL